MKLKKTPLLVGKTPIQQRLIDRDAEIANEFWLMRAKKEKYIGEKLAEKYGYVQKNAIYMAVARHNEREDNGKDVIFVSRLLTAHVLRGL